MGATQIAGAGLTALGVSEASGGGGFGKLQDQFESISGIKAKGQAKSAAERDRIRRKEALEKFLKERRKKEEEIKKLFRDLADPKKTAGELKKKIASIEAKTGVALGRTRDDINRLRNIAQTRGPTEMAKRLTDSQRAEEAARLEQLDEAGAVRSAGAFEQLAQRGGASAGARERLLGAQSGQSFREAQRERRAGALSRLGILSQDEARKLQLAQALPGQELAAAGLESQVGLAGAKLGQAADQFDITQQGLADRFRIAGEAGIGLKGQQLEAGLFGGGQLADVQAKAGQTGPGFFQNLFG